MSPIRRCSSKGKSNAIASGSTNSESSGSLLVGRPRAITLGGMEGLRVPTAGIYAKEKDPSEKGPDFRLADFLPMRWTGTGFEFTEEIDPEKVRRFSVKKNHKWENHLPTRSSFKTPPVGYACVYELWFNNCRVWWPLLELMTAYCSQRKITLGQYTANGIRVMVALMVLAAELDITMSVHLFEERTTPSITTKTGFFNGKMPSKVNHWNQSYCYVKINDASFEDPSVILNEYFNANIGCSDSFWEQVEAIRTLSHQHWPNISETRIQAALNRIVREKKKMGKFNFASLPSYAASIGTHPAGQEGSSSGKKFTKRRKNSHSDEGVSNPDVRSSPLELIDQTEMAMVTGDPTLEGELPEENRGSSTPAPQGDEVVEYPHLVDFHYHYIEIPFVGDFEARSRLFHQIKLKSKGMPELDELSQRGRYRKMARAGANKSKSLKKKENAKLKGKWDMSKEKVGQITTEKDQAMEMAEMEKSRGDLLSNEQEEIKAQKKMLESRLRELEQEKVEADSKFETTTKRLRQSRGHELDEQPAIQSKLFLYSQANGAIEGLEKIQALGMSIDEVLE
ncbi:hypothetical protein N665_0018s0042 [Sinapis alba]|nr:hypothetical protein N665_0018s0042 [Sinapis alba]